MRKVMVIMVKLLTMLSLRKIPLMLLWVKSTKRSRKENRISVKCHQVLKKLESSWAWKNLWISWLARYRKKNQAQMSPVHLKSLSWVRVISNKNVFRKISLNPVALLLRFSLIPMFKSFANYFDLWFAQMAKEWWYMSNSIPCPRQWRTRVLFKIIFAYLPRLVFSTG